MQEQNTPQYGVFVCVPCRDGAAETCDEYESDVPCGYEHADELPPLNFSECWPLCPCCGADLSLVTPLIVLEYTPPVAA